MKPKHLCPVCNKPASLDKKNNYRPFCSERCRLIDLGEWIQEGYSIADKDTSIAVEIAEPYDDTTKH